MEDEIGLSTHIIISTNNTIIFNKNKIIEEYTYLFKKIKCHHPCGGI